MYIRPSKLKKLIDRLTQGLKSYLVKSYEKPPKGKRRNDLIHISVESIFSLEGLLLSSVFFSALLLFSLFLIYPLISITSKAFITKNGVTLRYLYLITKNKAFLLSLKKSLQIAFCSTISSTLLAFPLAIVNNKFIYKGKKVLSTLLLTAMFTPPFVGAIGIKRFFAPYGTINLLLQDLNLISSPIHFLSTDTILPIVVIQTISFYPLIYLNLTTTLDNIDPSMEEAAVTLGINSINRYKKIIWPLIQPGFLAGTLLVFIRSFTDLGTPLAVNFNDVLPSYLYSEIMNRGDSPYGYAILFSVLSISLSIPIIFRFIFVVDKRHILSTKSYVKKTVYRPTSKQLLAIYSLFCMIITFSFIPHLGMVFTSFSNTWINTYLPESYTLESYRSLFSLTILSAIKNSITYAISSTLLSLILGNAIAYLIAKRITSYSLQLESLVTIPSFIPSILLGFSYFLLFRNSFFGNPILLLTASYTLRYMIYIVRTSVASIQQLSPSMEEAAMLFGASWSTTYRTILIPIMMPSILSGVLFILPKTILEVSNALILANPSSYHPLSRLLYELHGSQGKDPAIACALGCLIMLIIGTFITIANWKIEEKKGKIFRTAF